MSKSIRGVILHNQNILLIRRKTDKGIYYVLPGGHAEPNETDEETCKREVKEETNIDVTIKEKVYTLQEGEHHKSIYYLCEMVDEKDATDIKLIGEELKRNKKGNYYKPVWLNIKQLEKITLYPKKMIQIIGNITLTKFS